MKKVTFVLFSMLMILCISVQNVYAQDFREGSKLVNVGIGGVSGFGINASYDYGVFDTGDGVISLGGYTGLTFDDSKTAWGIAVRGTYRYQFDGSPFEVYGASMMGFRLRNSKTKFLGTIFAGGRFIISQSFSAYTEMGFASGATAVNFGIAYSF